jgi:hypothetical protein
MQFSKLELEAATENFSSSRLVGKGAYGSVYYGRNVRSCGTSAAVKVLNEVIKHNIILATCMTDSILCINYMHV